MDPLLLAITCFETWLFVCSYIGGSQGRNLRRNHNDVKVEQANGTFAGGVSSA